MALGPHCRRFPRPRLPRHPGVRGEAEAARGGGLGSGRRDGSRSALGATAQRAPLALAVVRARWLHPNRRDDRRLTLSRTRSTGSAVACPARRRGLTAAPRRTEDALPRSVSHAAAGELVGVAAAEGARAPSSACTTGRSSTAPVEPARLPTPLVDGHPDARVGRIGLVARLTD